MSHRYGQLAILLTVLINSFTSVSVNAADTLKITGPEGQTKVVNRQYGPTTKADTFWSIAQKMRPNNRVSVYQVMAAIYDANPHAFATANYNSLEAGMFLLIPAVDKMLAISADVAKQRATNNDKKWKNERTPKATKTKSKKSIISEIKKVEDQPDSAKKIAELEALIEKEQQQTISVTDELVRTKDNLTVAQDDLKGLKQEINELNDKLATLNEVLAAIRQKNAALRAENEALMQAAATQPVEQPQNFWRSLADNPLLLAVYSVLPVSLIIAGIIWFFRRKNKTAEEKEQVEEQPVTEPQLNEAEPQDIDLAVADEDELQQSEIAVHLDDSDKVSDGLDDLLEAPTDELDDLLEQPAESVDTSLDDLWAEALDEQIDGKEISSDVSDLLDQLDNIEEQQPEETSEIDDVLETVHSEITENKSEIENQFALDQQIDDAIDSNVPTIGTDSSEIGAERNDTQLDELNMEVNADVAHLNDEQTVVTDLISQTEEAESLDLNVEQAEQQSADTLDSAMDLEPTDDFLSAESTLPEIADESIAEQAIEDDIDFDSLSQAQDIALSNLNHVNEESVTLANETMVEGVDSEQTQSDDAFDIPLESSEQVTDGFDSEATDVSMAASAPDHLIDHAANISEAATEELTEQYGEKLDDLDALMAEFGVEPETSSEPVEFDVDPDVIESQSIEAPTDPTLDINTEDSLTTEESPVATGLPVDEELSDDDLLASFSNIKDEISDIDLPFENDNMTVDEALAALDGEQQENDTKDSASEPLVSDGDLTDFKNENGFIDIDKLLNDADQSTEDVDLYKDVDVDLSANTEMDNLLDNTSMIDVDDAENTVNAKLDLARAYIEIEDKDSAKALLEEVKADGNERQQTEAQALIETIS